MAIGHNSKATQDWIIELAATINQDDTFAEWANEIVDKKIDAANGMIPMWEKVIGWYGDDIVVKFPVVGSKGGDNPDIIEEPGKKSGSVKETSFYDELFAATDYDKRIGAELERLKTAYAESDKARYDREKALWNTRRTSIRAYFKKGIALQQIYQKVATMPGVAIYLARDTDSGTWEKTTKPFTLQDKTSPGKVGAISANTFLALKPDLVPDLAAAKFKGNYYDALMATKNTGGDEGGENRADTTIATFEEDIAALANYLEKVVGSSDRKSFQTLTSLLAREDSDDLLLSLRSIELNLNTVTSKFKGRIETLRAKAEGRDPALVGKGRDAA